MSEKRAPDWVMIAPFQPLRRFRRGDGPELEIETIDLTPEFLEGVVADTRQHYRVSLLPIDYRHQGELTASGEAPAAASIPVESLRVVRGPDVDCPAPGLWGRANWTPRGRRAVEDGEYNFLSINLRRNFLDQVTAQTVPWVITSAGLTNSPMADNNRPLAADGAAAGAAGLAAQSESAEIVNPLFVEETEKGKTEMEHTEIAKILGLPDAATEEEVRSALEGIAAKVAELEAKLAELRGGVAASQAAAKDADALRGQLATAQKALSDAEKAAAGKIADTDVLTASLRVVAAITGKREDKKAIPPGRFADAMSASLRGEAFFESWLGAQLAMPPTTGRPGGDLAASLPGAGQDADYLSVVDNRRKQHSGMRWEDAHRAVQAAHPDLYKAFLAKARAR